VKWFKKKSLPVGVTERGSIWRVLEANTGYWQKNIEWTRESVLAHHAVFSCISLISNDIAKLAVKTVRQDNGIWTEIPKGSKYAVLTKPNSYQTRIQFFESWLNSILIRGNAYILKVRNSQGIEQLHVLNPDLVLPMVSDDGYVFYQLGADNLSGIKEGATVVPASEIIHDRFNCFYHPLVGLSPLFASGLPAYMGIKVLENSARLFSNGSRPSGILTIPEAVSKERAQELSEAWEAKYGGENYGKVAVLGGNVKFEPVTMTAEESQLVQLLDLTDVRICSTYHIPPYKIGIGEMPSYNNVQALNQEYYNTALQARIESIEILLDEHLGFPADVGVEFDIDNLLRMDSKTQIETLKEGVGAAIMSPNEARLKINQKPVTGGESPMIQQQNYSLEAIARRDAKEDPFSNKANDTQPVKSYDIEEFVAALTKGLN
jgi:HK97 family phage portal protein